MSCATCRRIRSYVANKAAKALRLGQHKPKIKPSGKVYDRKRERLTGFAEGGIVPGARRMPEDDEARGWRQGERRVQAGDAP